MTTEKLFKPVAITLIIVILCLLGWVHKLRNEAKTSPIDSALYHKAEKDILKKQYGYKEGILLNEITEINKRYQTALNENKAIREREKRTTAKSMAIIKKLRETKPECDTMANEYEKIIAAKDSSYNSLEFAQMKCDSASVVKDSLITNYQAENVVDSARLAITEQEVIQAKKQTVKERKKGKLLAATVGGVMFIIWLVTGVVN